ncbi:MAG: lytic polysaccharide monooxygenase [Parashewanella sp.]
MSIRISKIIKIVLFGGLACIPFLSNATFAAGYVVQPESRAYACELGHNSQCGEVKYMPEAISASIDFTDVDIPKLNGHIVSAGNSSFNALDEQSPDRWCQKNEMVAGDQIFKWHITEPEKTKNWRYYITKSNWDPYLPLTRSSFEDKPFCIINGDGAAPEGDISQTCTVPQDHKGYQVIMAVWDIANTPKSYYQAIDVDIIKQANTPSKRVQIGTINPEANLSQGDVVTATLFDHQGNKMPEHLSVEIGDKKQGNANFWSHNLAEMINKNLAGIRAGQKTLQGMVMPMYSCNLVYASEHSAAGHFETQITKARDIKSDDFKIVNMDETLPITKSRSVNIHFTIDTQVKGKLEIKAFDKNGIAVGFDNSTLHSGIDKISFSVKSAQQGQLRLELIFRTSLGSIIQKERYVQITS